MSKPTFEQSAQTAKIVAAIRTLSVGETISYDALSKRVGFTVNSVTSSYARHVAERDYGVFVYCVRGEGLARGDGADMVDSGYGMFSSVKRKMKRCASRMVNAISQNLPEKEHQAANDMLARASIISDTASMSTVRSNRKKIEPGQKAEPLPTQNMLLQPRRRHGGWG